MAAVLGAGLLAAPAAGAASYKSCKPVVNPYAGSRYEGVNLSSIRVLNGSCAGARAVAKGAHRKALGLTPGWSPIRRFTWGGWRVRATCAATPTATWPSRAPSGCAGGSSAARGSTPRGRPGCRAPAGSRRSARPTPRSRLSIWPSTWRARGLAGRGGQPLGVAPGSLAPRLRGLQPAHLVQRAGHVAHVGS